jgi:phosphinothricin acetyltransferase
MAALRRARREDLPAVTAIYNDAVARTTGTFDTEAKTLDQQAAWFERHGDAHPIVVAEESGRVVGWGSLSAWSDRCAYARSAEVSVYVEEASRGRGVAGALLDELLRLGRAAGIKQALARITQGNDVSLRLHSRRGFVETGRLRRVGEKFGEVLDVHLLQASLEEGA